VPRIIDTIHGATLMLALTLVCALAPAWAQQEIPLYPNGTPGFRHARPEAVEDKHETGRLDRYISFVSDPTLTFFPVAAGGKPGPVVLVLPGGGFRYVCIDKEGFEVARWLNSIGIAAAVLKYRVVDPDAERNWDTLSPLLALGDAARAVRVLRANAAQWQIDPARVGVMGFSAGGTMAIRLTLDATDGNARAPDPVETLGSKPNFIALVYSTLPDQKMPRVDKQTPYFIAHAADDKKAAPGVPLKLYQHVVAAGGSAELHVFRNGDHGFGVQPKCQRTSSAFGTKVSSNFTIVAIPRAFKRRS
jgi:acetyl esterase/lipase